ncbi:MAG: hypothetical protein QM709_08335 [Spongiibacteraceae bacterium]
MSTQEIKSEQKVLHFKPEDIPLITAPPTETTGCMRSIKAGEMEIGATWTKGPTDATALYADLPGGVCPCDHYGYVFSGSIRARYPDGEEVVIGPGEIYYIPKGHWLSYDGPTHHLEINPHRELRELMSAITTKAEELKAKAAALKK